MKVYMVKALEENEYWGCFSSMEKAEAFITSQTDSSDLDIEEYVVDA